ncbi:DUF2931 family protein [Enterobacteriaceae bacterium H16N7]|nr:DUF2931 family protein [Dryocola clanedunensis]
MSVLLAIVLLAGCYDRRAEVTTPSEDGAAQLGKKLPYDHWRFSFIYPLNLPALVTQVYLEDGDSRGRIFRRLDPVDVSDLSVDGWHDVIGGYGGYFNRGKALPVRMTVCWDSVIDKKSYETEILFSRDTWQQMVTEYPDPYHPEKPYYRNKMAIGLAPGGTVRVWLENNGNPSVLQHPARQFTMTGNDMQICKGITKHPDGYVYYGKTPEFIKGKTYPYGEW